MALLRCMTDTELQDALDNAVDAEDYKLADRIERELEDREYVPGDDPDYPHDDSPALDAPWWEYR